MPDVLPVVESNQLDWLAEAANGMQGKPLTVYLEPGEGDGGRIGIVETGKGVPHGATELFQVWDESKMTPPDAVNLSFGRSASQPNGETHKLLEEHPDSDALFWSASAIEKFVLPYYVAQRLLNRDELNAIINDYKAGNIVAVLHVQPSKPFGYPGNTPYAVYPKARVGLNNRPIDFLTYLKELMNRK
jgi:hypothetical protein